jgi:hypothetical protein
LGNHTIQETVGVILRRSVQVGSAWRQSYVIGQFQFKPTGVDCLYERVDLGRELEEGRLAMFTSHLVYQVGTNTFIAQEGSELYEGYCSSYGYADSIFQIHCAVCGAKVGQPCEGRTVHAMRQAAYYLVAGIKHRMPFKYRTPGAITSVLAAYGDGAAPEIFEDAWLRMTTDNRFRRAHRGMTLKDLADHWEAQQ